MANYYEKTLHEKETKLCTCDQNKKVDLFREEFKKKDIVYKMRFERVMKMGSAASNKAKGI